MLSRESLADARGEADREAERTDVALGRGLGETDDVCKLKADGHGRPLLTTVWAIDSLITCAIYYVFPIVTKLNITLQSSTATTLQVRLRRGFHYSLGCLTNLLLSIRFLAIKSNTHRVIHAPQLVPYSCLQSCEPNANSPHLKWRQRHVISEQLILLPVWHPSQGYEAHFVNDSCAHEVLR